MDVIFVSVRVIEPCIFTNSLWWLLYAWYSSSHSRY